MQTLRASRPVRLVADPPGAVPWLRSCHRRAAQAADDVSTSEKLNADQLKRLAGLPSDQRDEIRDRLNQELAKAVCAELCSSGSMGSGNDCENVSAKAFGTFLTTPEKVLDYDGKNTAPFCAALPKWCPCYGYRLVRRKGLCSIASFRLLGWCCGRLCLHSLVGSLCWARWIRWRLSPMPRTGLRSLRTRPRRPV